MSREDEENAAFPGAPYASFQKGMTLRDYFAAAALQGDIANSGMYPSAVANEVLVAKAKSFYQLADGMLQARKEGA